MNFWRKQHKSWLWLLCTILLVVRVSDAHWHLCHDGNEPAQTIHVGDVATGDSSEPGHTDTDLNLVDSGLFKQLDHPSDLPALLAALAVLCTLVLTRRNPPIYYQPASYSSAAYRRVPPPRGPPR